MILGMRSRNKGRRVRRKPYQGGGSYEKPHISEHVKEPRPPEVFASELNGWQPASATENSVASPLIPPTDGNEAPSAVVHSMSETLADSESALKDCEWNQTASRVDPSFLNIEDPERIQSSSMSDGSSLHIGDPQRTLLSKPNDLPPYSTDSERIHSPLDLQDPQRSNFPAPVELSLPKSYFETTDILPLNGENPETGGSPKSIPSGSPDGRMSVLPVLDLTGDAQASESVPDEWYHPECILDRQDHHPPLPDGSDYPEPVFDTTEHLEPVLSGLDYPEVVPEELEHPQHISQGQDCPEPIFKEPDPSEHIPDWQNYPKAISDAQSRSELIKSHESLKGGDQQPHVRREARLHRLRWRSLKTRALVSEKRTELHQARFEMGDADAEFIKLSRQRWINGGHDNLALEASFKKLQAIRDTYGPLEEAYNTLEELLDREEYDLAELEEKIFKNGALPENHDSDIESQSNSSDEGDLETLEIITEQQNPLYKEYMSRLGDAGLHREAYSYLLNEHDNLLEALEASQRYGRKLLAEDQTTLAKFYAKEAKMSEELRQIDADVERLRLECVSKGLLAEDEDDENDILRTSDGVVGQEQAEYYRFPRLLERPGEGEDERRSKALLSEFRPGDTGDRITRWLLHKLRSSCSEVELLARFTDGLDTVDTKKWQEEVLYFWFVDSSNLPPSAYQLEPTLTAFPSSHLTDPNKASPKLFGEKQLIQLVVRSSSLSRSLEFGMWLKLAQMKGRSAVSNLECG